MDKGNTHSVSYQELKQSIQEQKGIRSVSLDEMPYMSESDFTMLLTLSQKKYGGTTIDHLEDLFNDRNQYPYEAINDLGRYLVNRGRTQPPKGLHNIPKVDFPTGMHINAILEFTHEHESAGAADVTLIGEERPYTDLNIMYIATYYTKATLMMTQFDTEELRTIVRHVPLWSVQDVQFYE